MKMKSDRRSGKKKVHKVETESCSDSNSENSDCEGSLNELYVQSIRKVDTVNNTQKPVS